MNGLARSAIGGIESVSVLELGGFAGLDLGLIDAVIDVTHCISQPLNVDHALSRWLPLLDEVLLDWFLSLLDKSHGKSSTVSADGERDD